MSLRTSFPYLTGPVAQGTAVSLFIRVAGIGLATLQAIFTARLLGPEGYGTVAFILSLSMIFAVLALFGTEHFAAREVARLQTQRDFSGLRGFLRTIRRGLAASVVLAALVFLASVWLLPPGRVDDETRSLATFAVVLFPLTAFVLQTQSVLRGFGRVWSAQVPLTVLRPGIFLVFLALAWLFAWDVAPLHFILATIGSSIFAVVAAEAVFRLTVKALGDVDAAPMAPARLARGAAPFFTLALLAILLGEVNTLLLSLWADAEQTGLFQPIARIAPLLTLGMQAVAIRYGPRITELWFAGEKVRLAAVTRQVTLWTTAFTVVSSCGLLLLAQPILGLFGPEFRTVAPALWWVVVAQVINAACGPVAQMLSMSEHVWRTFVPQLTGLLLNVAVCAWLIPSHGAIGAAVGLAVGIVGWNVAMLLAVRRHMGEDPSLLGILLGGKQGAGSQD